MTIEFGRGKDKKKRKSRSDKGKSRGGVRDAVNRNLEARGKRKAARKQLSETRDRLERKRLREEEIELDSKQVKRVAGRVGTAVKAAGLAAGVAAVGTKKGREALIKAGAKGLSKVGDVAKAGAKSLGDTAKDAAKEVGRGVAEGAKKATDEAKEKVQDTVKIRAATDKAKIADLGRRVKNKAKKDIETTKRVVGRKKKDTRKPIGSLSAGEAPKIGKLPKKKKSLRQRLSERAKKDRERRKRTLGFGSETETLDFARSRWSRSRSYRRGGKRVKGSRRRRRRFRDRGRNTAMFTLQPVTTADFSKKRSVRVKSFRRKDGTVVKASTRRVTKKEKKKTAGERIGDIGRGLIPVASAFATGAAAVSAFSDAQLRRQQARRELGVLGESRKFLGLAGGAGSGFKSVTAGIDSLKNSRTKLALENRKLELFERDLNQRDLNRVLRAEELKLKKRKRKKRRS